ncbi:MAG: exosome complex protein Rrp42 [Candidatus Hydrothermarchaeales archaeon]
MASEILTGIKKDYLSGLLREGKRLDGRGFDEYRQISVETGVSAKAEGSALVKIGNTQLMVGVKLILGEPFSDMPASGVLTTNAELIPLASPTFEKGPPDEATIELARVVDRGVRESKAIDLDKLCIVEGEKVWIVFIDIHVLDYDGNLFDASTLGAVAALYDAYIPKVENDRVLYGERTKQKLPLNDKPVETTFVKIDDTIVVDPLLDEELAMDARITLATTQKGLLCAMQKGGIGSFTQEEILDIMKRGTKKAEELRKHI